MLDGGKKRAEVLSWLLGLKGVAGTVCIMSQGEGGHCYRGDHEDSLQFWPFTWNSAYFGVKMEELGSRLVCVAARLRDRDKEQDGWTWYTY